MLLQLSTDRNGAVCLELNLILSGHHVPMLQHIGSFCSEKLGLENQSRRERRARVQLNFARLLVAPYGEIFDILADESCDFLLLQMRPDHTRKQYCQEILELPANDLGYYHCELLAVFAWSFLVALDLAAVAAKACPKSPDLKSALFGRIGQRTFTSLLCCSEMFEALVRVRSPALCADGVRRHDYEVVEGFAPGLPLLNLP